MSECIILSVDSGTRCIEAAFHVQGNWVVNRIFRPASNDGQPVDLSNTEEVHDFLDRYASANYDMLVPDKVPYESIASFLEKLRDNDTFQTHSLSEVQERLEKGRAGIEALIVDTQELKGSLAQIASELVVLEHRTKTLEAEINSAWWRRVAAWVKANSSLLGG